MSPLTDTPSWHALLAHREAMAGTTLEALWQRDPARGGALTFECAGIAVDFSKQRADAETLKVLTTLARERDVPAGISTPSPARVNVRKVLPCTCAARRRPT
jgi:glucose-6-phosphate isomerase